MMIILTLALRIDNPSNGFENAFLENYDPPIQFHRQLCELAHSTMVLLWFLCIQKHSKTIVLCASSQNCLWNWMGGSYFSKNVLSKPLEGLSILRANVYTPISFLMFIFWTFIPSLHFKALVWAAPRRCADHVLPPNVSNPSFHLSAHQNSHRQPARSILVRIKSFHLSAHGEYFALLE